MANKVFFLGITFFSTVVLAESQGARLRNLLESSTPKCHQVVRDLYSELTGSVEGKDIGITNFVEIRSASQKAKAIIALVRPQGALVIVSIGVPLKNPRCEQNRVLVWTNTKGAGAMEKVEFTSIGLIEIDKIQHLSLNNSSGESYLFRDGNLWRYQIKNGRLEQEKKPFDIDKASKSYFSALDETLKQ